MSFSPSMRRGILPAHRRIGGGCGFKAAPFRRTIFERAFAPAALILLPLAAAAGSTNSFSLSSSSTPLPDVGLSLVRVLGALALVLALFLGGVWLFRNWQRLVIRHGRAPRLNVLEVRSLGGRHALYVVGYEQERFLVASSPGGVNLVSHLQSSTEELPDPETPLQPSFALSLTRMLKGK